MLDDCSFLDYLPGWFEGGKALFETLVGSLEWRQETIVLFGRSHAQPRLTAWVGERGYGAASRYRDEVAAAPWPEELAGLRELVAERYSMRPDAALANLYRDERDSVGWHADDEAYLGPAPVVVSLSLGAPRRFLLRPKPSGPALGRPRVEVVLGDGDVLVMAGATQRGWQHSVPRSSRPAGPRICLTLRESVGGPRAGARRR